MLVAVLALLLGPCRGKVHTARELPGLPRRRDRGPARPQRGRRTLEGGGATGHGAVGVFPGDSDPDSSSCQTGDGHRFALAGGSVFLRGDPGERGAAAAGGERPAP